MVVFLCDEVHLLAVVVHGHVQVVAHEGLRRRRRRRRRRQRSGGSKRAIVTPRLGAVVDVVKVILVES